jgi:hypothetical protein
MDRPTKKSPRASVRNWHNGCQIGAPRGRPRWILVYGRCHSFQVYAHLFDLLGRPDNSFRFLVFSGFRNLLEHSGRVFAGSSRFYVCEPVFLSLFVLVFCFFSFFEFEPIFKIDFFKKNQILNSFKFEQFWIWTK